MSEVACTEYEGWVSFEDDESVVYVGLIGGLVSLLLAFVFYWKISSIKLDDSKPQTVAIAKLIADCSAEFLIDEYKALLVFCIFVAIILSIFISWQASISFLIGAALSALAGWLGMKIATKSNVRTTLACQGSLNDGLQVAFRSGAVMGLTVVGTGLVGLSLLFIIFNGDKDSKEDIWDHLAGFAFGGSSIALFARVGGGIYTKAADVGADLVGKVEEDLEEDSCENPATIADNVGDNVGDVAGMGADLFESFVGSILAAATLGAPRYCNAGIALPFWVAGLGAFCSICGIFMLRTKGNALTMKGTEVLESLLNSIRFSIYGASFLVLGASLCAIGATFGFEHDRSLNLFVCVVIGLVCGNLIGYFTEYATSYTYEPTKSIARMSDIGAAPVIIQGIGVGMLSTVPPVMFIFASILGAYAVEGIYGIAISAVGMLSTLGVTLATDAFGPVADNAGGIAEMAPDSEISEDVRNTTDALDALGNTTAATGKGFAIGSAVLTALALMNAFAEATGLDNTGVDLLDAVVLPGVIFGAMLPYVFGALTMLSVGKAAESIMWECRDQLNQRFFDGTALSPQRCVKICAAASLREMVAPGVLAIVSPIIIGSALGAKGLLGMLMGAISSGFLLAVMMSNAGGAWDNAKKYVEKGGLGPGKGKKTDNHKAVVVGDTVGDPFKDTSGPSLNILIKLMTIVSLVIAPLMVDEVNGVKVPKEAWDDEGWPVALALVVVVFVLGWVYNKYMNKFAQIHDKATIIQQCSRRHEQNGQGEKKEQEGLTQQSFETAKQRVGSGSPQESLLSNNQSYGTTM